jgi:purine-nucleoside phosphorylase
MEPDVKALAKPLGFSADSFRPLIVSRLYEKSDKGLAWCLAGPVMGAPQAVILLEQLIAYGAVNFIFFGWCGSLSASVLSGDLVLPSFAFIDEGTSQHYAGGLTEVSGRAVSFSSRQWSEEVKKALGKRGYEFREGPVWTTDALFRETREKVESFSKAGAVAVDMELSALFSVAEFRKVSLAGLLVVSDELFSGTWRPGFGDPSFSAGRHKAVEVIGDLCRT